MAKSTWIHGHMHVDTAIYIWLPNLCTMYMEKHGIQIVSDPKLALCNSQLRGTRICGVAHSAQADYALWRIVQKLILLYYPQCGMT
jgi:hypothetical protein